MTRLTVNNIKKVVVYEYKDRKSLKQYNKIYVYMKSNKISDVREYFNDCPKTVINFMIASEWKRVSSDKLPNYIVTKFIYS